MNYLAVKEDITEKKRIEEELSDYQNKLEDIVEERTTELRLSEEKYKALAESSEDVIMRFDRDLKHLYVNTAVERVTGKKVEEFIGKSHGEIDFPKELIEQWDEALGKTFKNKKINRIEFKLPNDEWYDWILIPEFDENGEVNTITTSARNISSLKNYEAKIQEALEKEKDLNSFKTNFISTASHQFRTPLASILSSSQMLKRYSTKWDEETKEQYYERISQAIKGLAELMDDLLIVSKAEEGMYKIKRQLINVDEQMEIYINDVRNSNEENVQIEYKNYSSQNKFSTDIKLFQEIVNNLLTNAVKYNLNNEKILIETRTFENNLVLSVRDKGIGIPEKEQQYIFESFYRVKNGLELPGTGLGLNIVKRAVNLLKGNIELESKVNEGSSFIITLPNLSMENDAV